MRKLKKPASIYEALRKKWKIRIMLEKAYTEDAALWMTDRIESLISHISMDMHLWHITNRTEPSSL